MRVRNSVEVESNATGLRCDSRGKINQPVGPHLLGKFPASRISFVVSSGNFATRKTVLRRRRYSSVNVINVFHRAIVRRCQDASIGCLFFKCFYIVWNTSVWYIKRKFNNNYDIENIQKINRKYLDRMKNSVKK